MNLELTDEQAAALERELRRIIADDRYPLSARIRTLKAILNKIRPTLRQADQARTDFAAIENNLEFIMGQLSGVPTRKQLARYSLLVMVGTAALCRPWHSCFR
jgi:hypothetical protein